MGSLAKLNERPPNLPGQAVRHWLSTVRLLCFAATLMTPHWMPPCGDAALKSCGRRRFSRQAGETKLFGRAVISLLTSRLALFKIL